MTLLEALGIAMLAGVVFVILPGRGNEWGKVIRGYLPGCLTGIAAVILALVFVETQWPLLAMSGFGVIVLLVIVGVFWIGLYGLAIGLYGLVRLFRR